MPDAADMSTPVTRGELKEELATLRLQIQAVEENIQAMGVNLQAMVKATEKQLQSDLASHAGALFESMSALITAHDDKYKDLPGRVSRIEAKVFKRTSR